MDYYYKYLKYKKKYLDLQGGKMEYGLYGLYSYFGEKLNLRKNNKRFNEINYVHDLPLYKDAKSVNSDNIIIKHLRSKYKRWIKYNEIKSFDFVPYDETNKLDNEQIQKLIDTTYFTKELKELDNKELRWTTLNQLKRFRYKGYSDEISREIIDSYADKATELLGDENNYKVDVDVDVDVDVIYDDITKIRQEALQLISVRKCEDIHKHHNKSENYTGSYEKILLDEIIDVKQKQLLLSSVVTGLKYENNPTIYRDPFTLVNEKLGILSWNMIINKATINCIMKNHDVLFPMRIILDMNPETLFYDNIMITKKYSNYMGFFLVRFINDNDEYTVNSKPHDSDEQYYIFFIFKNENNFFKLPLFTYTLTNFRNNIINWGTVTEKKTVLFHEILQLICMYLNDNVHFYLISIENKSDHKSENYNNIKSWIHSADLKYINFDNEIHILVSKYDIVSVNDKLGNQNKIQIKDNYKFIQYNNYKLIQCHFGWYDDDLSQDRFCIKLGDMVQEEKDKLKKNACINELNDRLYKLDKKRYIQSMGLNNVSTENEIDKFDLIKDSIMKLKLKNLI
jgi:hypothetical protein